MSGWKRYIFAIYVLFGALAAVAAIAGIAALFFVWPLGLALLVAALVFWLLSRSLATSLQQID